MSQKIPIRLTKSNRNTYSYIYVLFILIGDICNVKPIRQRAITLSCFSVVRASSMNASQSQAQTTVWHTICAANLQKQSINSI